ncbi:MAG: T9SS type A sorting domain-containing protein, partial [Gemmatimonadetes bacterium]|nr:T9SS type A sorting domain-containing protein [Gemmatimonadota bacterium]
GDYDNDGDVDLFVPHAPTGTTVPDLWRNDGGTFVLADTSTVGDILSALPGPQASEWADYDSDGDLDMFVINLRPNPVPIGAPRRNRLYRNEGTSNGWLHVSLEGSVSNRSGIGAVIRAYAVIGGQPVQQVREVVGGPTAFEFQRELRAHFGLGDAAVVDSVVVEWPSGAVQRLTGVAVDQSLVVQEAAAVGTPLPQSGAVPALRVSPNPFRGRTDVSLALAAPGPVRITVFDVTGRAVRRLADGEWPAGTVRIPWDGRDGAGRAVAPGIYFIRLLGSESTDAVKTVVLR